MRIERFAFFRCRSLRRAIMRGVIVVEQFAFNECEAEKDEFGCKRESGEWYERKNRCNQLIIPDAPVGYSQTNVSGLRIWREGTSNTGWIRSVRHKILQYQAEHHCVLLDEDVAPTLELALSSNDVVMNSILPFLVLPHTLKRRMVKRKTIMMTNRWTAGHSRL